MQTLRGEVGVSTTLPAKPTVPDASPHPSQNGRVQFASIVSALSYALDLTEGQPSGHTLRSCVLGMRIGYALKLPSHTMNDLYYALLLKDTGCTSNAGRMFQITGVDEIESKRAIRSFDWTRFDLRQALYMLTHLHREKPWKERACAIRAMMQHSSENASTIVELRCQSGSRIAAELGLSAATAAAIYSLDEMWNGVGYPDQLSGSAIPLLSRILSIAQTLDVFYTSKDADTAIRTVTKRSGRWFDPNLVDVARRLHHHRLLWHDLDTVDLLQHTLALEPENDIACSGDTAIDNVCGAFAGIIDAKSHFTYTHSHGVANAADKIASQMNLGKADRRTLRRASLLHDVGKLGVPNSILEKPEALTPAEWARVRQHPFHTFEIVNRIPSFQKIARIAADHHERLDGSGYYRGVKGDELCMLSRILVVADTYDALYAGRPYREKLGHSEIMKILWEQAPHAFDPSCVEAMQSAG
jgi:putative nucleotidyltransferase with HDIG domain